MFSITDNAIRAAVFVAAADAPIWDIKSGKEMRKDQRKKGKRERYKGKLRDH